MRIVKLLKTYGCFNHLQMPMNLHYGVHSIWDVLRERKPVLKNAWWVKKPGEPKGKDCYQNVIANWPKGCSLVWQEMGEL